jgi:hypothetical protein
MSSALDDFNALFQLVSLRKHEGVNVDFGHQMHWAGVTAGLSTEKNRFIQAEGLHALLDDRVGRVVFAKGSAEILHDLLVQKLDTLNVTKNS